MIAFAIGSAVVSGIFAALALGVELAYRRQARAAGAWLRCDHPPLRGAERAGLQAIVAEQAERVSRAIAPPPARDPGALAAMMDVAARRVQERHYPAEQRPWGVVR